MEILRLEIDWIHEDFVHIAASRTICIHNFSNNIIDILLSTITITIANESKIGY